MLENAEKFILELQAKYDELAAQCQGDDEYTYSIQRNEYEKIANSLAALSQQTEKFVSSEQEFWEFVSRRRS